MTTQVCKPNISAAGRKRRRIVGYVASAVGLALVVALALALERMVAAGMLRSVPLFDSVAATSVGIVEDQLLLDLAYEEDSRAQVDMNVVMTGGGRFVEVQASAEGRPYTEQELQQLITLAAGGIRRLAEAQQELLHMKFSARAR